MYPDAGLAPSTEYFYRLRATNILGEALCTNEARAITPSGLVHWWRLHETGGVTAADSAGTNHGVVTSGIWTNGQLGGGLYFDSTNDLVEMNAPDLTPPWTASARVRRSMTRR